MAASHFDADAIIHFGHACLSKVTRLPVHYVFANFKLNSNIFANELNNVVPNAEEDLMVFYSTAYYYQLGTRFRLADSILISKVQSFSKCNLLCRQY